MKKLKLNQQCVWVEVCVPVLASSHLIQLATFRAQTRTRINVNPLVEILHDNNTSDFLPIA
jgi:hypothetical protein